MKICSQLGRTYDRTNDEPTRRFPKQKEKEKQRRSSSYHFVGTELIYLLVLSIVIRTIHYARLELLRRV